MKCPCCLAENSSNVKSTRYYNDFETRRRRECTVCGCRFSTVEVVVVPRARAPLDRSGACGSVYARSWYSDHAPSAGDK